MDMSATRAPSTLLNWKQFVGCPPCFPAWSTNDDVLALPGLATERDIAQWLRCLGTEHEIVGDMVFTCSEHDGLARLDLLNCLL